MMLLKENLERQGKKMKKKILYIVTLAAVSSAAFLLDRIQ